MVRLRVLTNSEMKARRRCSREHHISYELGYRSAREDAEALRFGTAIHLALAAWWLARHSRERLEAALAALPLEMEPFEHARARAMLVGYDARWCDEPLEVVAVSPSARLHAQQFERSAAARLADVPTRWAVEVEFAAPLVNPMTNATSRTFELGGKLDALVLNHLDGRVYILEHKTSSDDLSPGSQYWQLLQLDTQISTYYAGARSLGFNPAGVVYDVLGKPKQRPLKATPNEARTYTATGKLYANQRALDESVDEYAARVSAAIEAAPDRYFMRGHVVRLEQEERDAQWDAWAIARDIRDAELAQRWPRNPDSCRRFGHMCSYFGHCTGTESLDDEALFRHTTNVHEELETPQP